MESDLERRIQQLRAEIVATDDPEKLNGLCRGLQKALSQYIGDLRDRLKEYGKFCQNPALLRKTRTETAQLNGSY